MLVCVGERGGDCAWLALPRDRLASSRVVPNSALSSLNGQVISHGRVLLLYPLFSASVSHPSRGLTSFIEPVETTSSALLPVNTVKLCRCVEKICVVMRNFMPRPHFGSFLVKRF